MPYFDFEGPPSIVTAFDALLEATPNTIAYANVSVTQASNNPGHYTSAQIPEAGFVAGNYILNPKNAAGTVIGKLRAKANADTGTYTARQSVRAGDIADAVIAAIWSALTSALTTAGSVGKRIADNLDAAVSSRLASGSYVAPDNTGIGNLTSRLTAPRAANLDNLDATISSRLDAGSYTAPNNTDITFIRDILEADVYTDVTATPWDVVWIKKGTGTLTTGTVLLRQKLRTTAAANVTSTDTIVGRRTQS